MFTHKKAAIILIAVLAGLSIFSIYKYIVVLGEKYALTQQIYQIEGQVSALEKEKQNLLQALEKEKEWAQRLEEESTGLKGTLKANEERINKFKDDLVKTQQTIEQLNTQIAAMRAEGADLRAQVDKLKLDVISLSQENEALKAKFSSLAELRNAIRDLKREMRQGEKTAGGNQGFITKDGKSTFPARVIIEVNPALNK